MLHEKKRPGRLFHALPPWLAADDAIFHLRIRVDRTAAGRELTAPPIARSLLDSAIFYALQRRWWPHLFLLMPDHLHALVSFPPGVSMSGVVADWKRWHARANRVHWQDGFFDHRLRREESLEHAIDYIRRNPVVRGLCGTIEEWPWRINAQDVSAAFDAKGGA